MALSRLISRGQSGLEAYEVSVEVHLAGGLPGFTITGLPTAAVRESKDRVRAALQTCGFAVPARRITVHLGPADVPKDGGRFDLAIALGIIQAAEKPDWTTQGFEFLGELSLGGEIKPVNGCVPAALAVARLERSLIVPGANAAEAALVPEARVYTAGHLTEVVAMLNGETPLMRVPPAAATPADKEPGPALDEVKGHTIAKRALTIAAAGGHNLLMIGPPGSGKSMLAERMNSLLPPLSDDELLSVASIASVAGSQSALAQGKRRPFRSPHHTCSAVALVGGGVRPRPGEVSLAHHGVLFLDELPEFSRAALEALREPLESARVSISRLGHQAVFPAEFQLVAAMNPCPCGYLGDGTERCICPGSRVRQYRARISGPLLDRFDLHIAVPQVSYSELTTADPGIAGSALTQSVLQTRTRQENERGVLNARLGDRAIWQCARLDREASRLLIKAQERWKLSTRSVVRILKLARTIADLDGCEHPGKAQLAEALQLRVLDRPAYGDTV